MVERKHPWESGRVYDPGYDEYADPGYSAEPRIANTGPAPQKNPPGYCSPATGKTIGGLPVDHETDNTEPVLADSDSISFEE